jgi:hypothetical protein
MFPGRKISGAIDRMLDKLNNEHQTMGTKGMQLAVHMKIDSPLSFFLK